MTRLVVKFNRSGLNGVYYPSRDTIHIHILADSICKDSDGEYIEVIDRITGETERFGVESFVLFLLNHEYNHAVIGKFVSDEASDRYDYICNYLSELTGIDM